MYIWAPALPYPLHAAKTDEFERMFALHFYTHKRPSPARPTFSMFSREHRTMSQVFTL